MSDVEYSLDALKEKLGINSKKIDYKKELNDEQYTVVMHNEGPLLVLAGAGAGKTRALTYRVARLIEDGVSPKSILLLTFTKHASNEMLSRASSILDDRCKDIAGGTYHSFANKVLRKYGAKIGLSNDFTLIDKHDAKEVMDIAKRKTNLDVKGKAFPMASMLVNLYSSSINKNKSIMETVRCEYSNFVNESENIVVCIGRYNKLKREMNLLDYDDLLVKLLELLKTNPDVASNLSNTYKYIMVDEYQDSNYIQSQILRQLCVEHDNIMVVGDEQQSMYGFRGAEFSNIMNFPKQYKGCKTMLVTTNYRCTQGILNVANKCIENAKEKYPKELKANKSTLTDKPLIVNVGNNVEEAMFICNEVIERHKNGELLKDMSVLSRTGYNSAELEIMLSRLGIPFKKVGGIKFLEQSHVKDFIAYLRVLANPRDNIAWMRLLKLIKGLGVKGAEAIVAHINSEDNSFKAVGANIFSKTKYYPDLVVLARVLDDLAEKEFTDKLIGLSRFYLKDTIQVNYPDWENRKDDITVLIDIGKGYKDLDTFLSAVMLEADVVTNESSNLTTKADDYLTISTIHSAKGLEWNTVFILSCVDGVIPSFMCKSDSEVEEERRVFYVAVTRAKTNLFVLTPKLVKSGRGEFYAKKSGFLEESGMLRCFDTIKIK